MAKHFLYLTNDRLVAMLWRGGRLEARESFPPGDGTMASFSSYVERHHRVPTYLVTDLVEEDFRIDTAPHLRGTDQAAVLGRKLAQHYRATSFRHAIVQDRESEGRRDDRMLFHAITNGELLKPWLAVLESAQVPLEGIYSSAVLSSRLLQRLDLFLPHTLLVTIVPDFGLRQTYFQNQQIKFSRITPVVYDEGQSVGGLIAAETSRTWQYLDSLRHFSGGEVLEVCLLVHARDREMIASALRPPPQLRYRFLDIEDVAKRIKLTTPPNSSHAETILTHVYANSKIQNHFAEPQAKRFAIFRRVRMGLYAVTAVALAVGIIGTQFNLNEASRVSTAITSRDTEVARLQSEYQNITASILALRSTSDVVRDASQFYNNQIRPQPAAPGDMLRELSTVISQFQRVRLLQVLWTPASDEKVVPPFTPIPAKDQLEVTSNSNPNSGGVLGAANAVLNNLPGAAPNAESVDPNPPLPGNKFHVGIIDATVIPFDGNFRETLAEVQRFNAALARLPGFKATIESMPLDTRSVASLTATGKRTGTAPFEARFVIKIVRKVGGA